MTARVFKLNEIEYGLHGFGNLVDQLSLLEHLKLPVAECFVIGPDIFEEFLKLHNAHGEFGKVRSLGTSWRVSCPS